LWLVFAFFLPIPLFGMKFLYAAWLDAPKTGEGALSHLQQSYLTRGGFVFRGFVYFAIWLALMLLFNAMSRQQDVDREDRGLRRRLKFFAGPGIILYVLQVAALRRMGRGCRVGARAALLHPVFRVVVA